MMPPKRIKIERDDKLGMVNPRVILQPLRTNSPGHHRQSFTTKPPVAAFFNKPELSDIKIIVEDNSFYAHRLVLAAASDVFFKMLGSSWLESQNTELVLREERECVKVFDSFLEYCYSGRIDFTESNTIPLFLLADKYNITPLYEECVRIIEAGLKVYTAPKSNSTPKPSTSRAANFEFMYPQPSSSLEENRREYPESSSHSDQESDTESEDSRATVACVPRPPPEQQHTIDLVADETFPLTLVMKMLTFCHDERIASAALYNLKARLAVQIKRTNYGVWNDLPQELLLLVLDDDYYCCSEYVLFKAAISWLLYQEERNTPPLVKKILFCIRYPFLAPDELYAIETEDLVKKAEDVTALVRQAIRFQVFRNCPAAQQSEEWSGKQYQKRIVKKS